MGLMKLYRKKNLESFEKVNAQDIKDDFGEKLTRPVQEPYLEHPWISIAVELLARNVARAKFEIKNNGKAETGTPAAKLFEAPGPMMSGYDLWKQTCSWWNIEGEAFWYFGNDYVCGIPEELVILNPRHMQHVVSGGRIVKWLYTGDDDGAPFSILPDEIVHFRDWNPFNRWRGISPLVMLAAEIDQDVLAARQNTGLLKKEEYRKDC